MPTITLTKFKHPTNQTVTLQSVGHVLGTPASEIKIGDTLVWNFGSTSKVIELLKETKHFLTFKVRVASGKTYERKLKKTRLVAISK